MTMTEIQPAGPGSPTPPPSEDQAMRALIEEARAHQQRRQKRTAVAAVLALALTGALVGIFGSGGGGGTRPTGRGGPHPAAAHPLASSQVHGAGRATSVDLTADETEALAAYVAQQVATAPTGVGPIVSVQSAPVVDNGTLVAAVAFTAVSSGRPVQILAYHDSAWSPIATLPPPGGPPIVSPQTGALFLVPGSPIWSADASGAGRPDFLILFQAADNTPGVVVSSAGGQWHYVLTQFGSYPVTPVLARNPAFSGTSLVTTYDSCVPDCASGQNFSVTWSYDAADGMFVAPVPK
jgi:hypothetical protein